MPNPLTISLEQGEEARELPSHSEIISTYEKSSNNNAVKIAQKATRGAFERSGVVNNLDEGTPHTLDQFGAREVQDFGATQGLESFDRPDAGVPQIFYKKIPGSDEVLLITRLNNGLSPEDSTVAIAVVKEINGSPQVRGLEGVGRGARSLYTLMNETEFKNRCTDNTDSSLESRLIRGELSVRAFESEYNQTNGAAFTTGLQERDQRLQVSGESARAESIMLRTELIQRLEARYVEVMQTAISQQSDVFAETERAREALRLRRAQEGAEEGYPGEPEGYELFELLALVAETSGDKPEGWVEDMFRTAVSVRYPDMTEEQINEVINFHQTRPQQQTEVPEELAPTARSPHPPLSPERQRIMDAIRQERAAEVEETTSLQQQPGTRAYRAALSLNLGNIERAREEFLTMAQNIDVVDPSTGETRKMTPEEAEAVIAEYNNKLGVVTPPQPTNEVAPEEPEPTARAPEMQFSSEEERFINTQSTKQEGKELEDQEILTIFSNFFVGLGEDEKLAKLARMKQAIRNRKLKATDAQQ